MSRPAFHPGLMARAALTRMDHGDEPTRAEALERIKGYGDGMTKPQLVQVIGILAAAYLRQGESK